MPRRQTGKTDRRGNPENLVPQFAQITHALSGIDLPQDRDGLIRFAEANDADKEVLALLEDFPEQDYETMADILAAAGGAVDTDAGEDEEASSDEDDEDMSDEDDEDADEDTDEDADEDDEDAELDDDEEIVLGDEDEDDK
jgi:hypothetical protein